MCSINLFFKISLFNLMFAPLKYPLKKDSIILSLLHINTLTNKIASSSALKKDQLVKLEFVCNNETKLLEYTKLNMIKK